jgi:serine/threonine-protein kinase
LVTLTQDILSISAYLEVPESSFRITTKLSQGGGGEVFLADALDDKTRKFGNLLVVKRIKSNNESQELTPKQVKLFEQEFSVMAMLQSYKNISKLIGYFKTRSHCILMKYYPMGSFDKFLQNRKNALTKSVFVHFISDIAYGIRSLHQTELSHSDIKTANILLDVDEDGFVFCVLTDFGIT